MNLSSMRALVVDDEAHLRHYFVLILQMLGVGTCTEAASVEEARAAQAARPHEIILLDVNLPGVGGLDWLRELRAAEDDAVVVMVSSQAGAGLVTEAAQAGADGFLRKDVKREEIATELLRIFADVFEG